MIANILRSVRYTPADDVQSDPPAGPAAEALAQRLADIAAAGRDSQALIAKLQQRDTVIVAARAARDRIADLRARLVDARAVELNDGSPVDGVEDLAGELAAAEAELARLADFAEVAIAARPAVQDQADAVQRKVEGLHDDVPRLTRAALLERLASNNEMFRAELARFIGEYVEIAALTSLIDRLGPRVAGSSSIGSDWMRELVLHLPFTKGADGYNDLAHHDLRERIARRAEEIAVEFSITVR